MCLCSQSPFLTTSPGNHQPNFCPYSFAFSTVSYKWNHTRGTWVAQAVKRPTSAQVMISRSVSSSPASDSVLTAQSLEPASDSVSPCLSTPSPFALHLSLSLKNKWTLKKINKWNHTVCSLLWLVPFSIILLRFIHVCFFFNFFNVYLFLRNREHKQERGRERERHRTRSRLQALSAQSPIQGMNLRNMRSWPEPKSVTYLTEPPRHPRDSSMFLHTSVVHFLFIAE